jgi:hypothetical protein
MPGRLERRGRDNCGLCPLCKQNQESAAGLFSHCHYTKRLWNIVNIWLGIANIQTQVWTPGLAIDKWWAIMACSPKPNRKAIASLTMLVRWTIWNERNVRVLKNKAAH